MKDIIGLFEKILKYVFLGVLNLDVYRKKKGMYESILYLKCYDYIYLILFFYNYFGLIDVCFKLICLINSFKKL